MPNGRPGDHPYFDVVNHGSKIFGDEIDSMIRSAHARWGAIDEIVDLALENDPRWGNTEYDSARVLQQLNDIMKKLESTN